MKSDQQIQKDVMEEIKWAPFLKPSEIGVAVKNGIVTLSGQVDSYSKKIAAENATKKVAGVKAIAEDIQIGVTSNSNKSDTEIAEAVFNALKWHSGVKENEIKIKVEDGNVRLDGEVEWEFERTYAKKTIENMVGVRSVLNLISVKPKISPWAINQKISAAFHRSATINAGKITTEVTGTTVTLYGTVRSFTEMEDAINAAWNAPGVANVVCRIAVELPEHSFVD